MSATAPEHPRTDVAALLKIAGIWIVGHASRFLPPLVVLAVLAATWRALGQVHPREVTHALRDLQMPWLAAAVGATLLNIGVMGLYDVVAFRLTRTHPAERWSYGAVAFAWSNFLTLGPFAGPAIRFWLYRPAVEHSSDLDSAVLSITIAFASGLIGWTIASAAVPAAESAFHLLLMGALAFACSYVVVYACRVVAVRIERFDDMDRRPRAALRLAVIGWTDWWLAFLVFVMCLRSTGVDVSPASASRSFFFGQAIGLASLVPGGFGSSDAFWIAHLPAARAAAAAALVVYRAIYYIVPWAIASLVLLAWATRRATRRITLARQLVAGLVGAGGALVLLSTAWPVLSGRLAVLERFVPLALVEASHITAALTGLLLLVLARGLAKGYRLALNATVTVLLIGAVSVLLKGLGYEEAVALGALTVAAWTQTPLFDRPSHGMWLTGRDMGIAILALALFLVAGAFAHRIRPAAIERVGYFGYRFERARYLRTAGTLVLAVSAGTLAIVLRVPVRFTRLGPEEIDRTLELHAAIGRGTSAMMVANGDKAVFRWDDRGFCLYRTIGPYLVCFADPVVAPDNDPDDFLTALFTFAEELDRRPVFYQISLDWIPPLHDRGYPFFKLGEEGHVLLNQVTLEGHQGKMYRQILRRAERDALRFRVADAGEVESLLPELRAVSDEWLRAKAQRERQFSIGFFDERYLTRFPCALVERITEGGPRSEIAAFTNLLCGPRREELSVDLMRYRGSNVMDFLFASLFLYGKASGFKRFNLGMAPLASVGQFPGAYRRERLANLLFQHGEYWYNFQGLRQYKEKFNPVWEPRYLAYPNAWEWPMVVTNTSALIAGGWTEIIFPKPERRPRTN